MKKVGLAVVTYVDNFGSCLQSFATIQAVNNLGYECEIINIDGLKNSISKKRLFYFLSRVLNFSEIRSYVVTIKGLLQKIINKKYKYSIAIRKKAFINFKTTNFKYSSIFSSWSELSNYASENYSTVLVGSDQLWRPVNICGEFYTLNWVPDSVNKVSYATSFGVSSIPKRLLDKAQRFISRLNFISVREEDGQKLIKQICQLESKLVCDPTLLFTKKDWLKFAENHLKKNGEYILCYFLGQNKQYLSFVNEFKRYTNLKVCGLVHCAGYNSNVNFYMDETPFDTDPLDFVNLVNGAKYVLTDSFHCCVFSILMEKEFFAFKRFEDKDEMSTNNRLTTLFKKLDICNRILNGKEDVSYVLKNKINYDKTKKLLACFRDESFEYLKKSLNNGK